MMEIKIILLGLVIWAVGPPLLFAQEASMTTGGEASGNGGSVSYSVGQAVYQTKNGTSESIAEGVQQPYEISVLTGIQESDILLHISAYPNPVNEYLILNIPVDFKGQYQFSLFDMNGKIISQQEISASETEIEMAGLEPGPYFIKVSAGKREIKTFKIIKN